MTLKINNLMVPRKAFSKLKERYLRSNNSRNVSLKLDNPIITFTFDDFPASAYKIAGAMLEEYKSRGTYYASMGLMGCNTDDMGEHFTSENISEMVKKGHEIGCHTYSHANGRNVPIEEYIVDAGRNREALSDYIEGTELLNFSYPYGKVTPKIKQSLGNKYMTCRGTFPGINTGTIDLNLLRANRLYSNSINHNENLNLIKHNTMLHGWLIFYTHDIGPTPSPWGCTPEYFSKVVTKAVNSGADILTMKEAYERIRCQC